MRHELLIDQSVYPEWLKPLPSNALKIDDLVRVVLRYLALAGATRESIMTTFQSEPVMWPLPATYGIVDGEEQMLTLPYIGDFEALSELHEKVRDKVRRLGWHPDLLEDFTAVWQERSLSKLMFTVTDPGKAAQNLFSAEFALNLSARSSRLIFQGTSCHRRLQVNGFSSQPLGLVGTRHPVTQEDMAVIREALQKERGWAFYTGFSTLDRVWLWVQQNAKHEGAKGVRRALALLKLQGGLSSGAKIEQGLANLEYMVPTYDQPVEELLFTLDNLDMIRDMWQDQSMGTYEALQNLYREVCPNYMDHDQWMKVFQVEIPEEDKLKPKHIKQIDAGMERFVFWFLQKVKK